MKVTLPRYVGVSNLLRQPQKLNLIGFTRRSLLSADYEDCEDYEDYEDYEIGIFRLAARLLGG
jgi:hypothetical protein